LKRVSDNVDEKIIQNTLLKSPDILIDLKYGEILQKKDDEFEL
jgi:hypothetical protein